MKNDVHSHMREFLHKLAELCGQFSVIILPGGEISIYDDRSNCWHEYVGLSASAGHAACTDKENQEHIESQ